ncbi:MAG: MGMT family protein [Muribaculaceae bacterium]|nr:MGMT family protein [Muribaculaceae bacterium]
MKIIYDITNGPRRQRCGSSSLRREYVDMGIDTIEIHFDSRGIHSSIPAHGAKATMTRAQMETMPLIVTGSHFFCRVMEQLAALPAGTTTTYGAIATRIGNPRASRAVGQAVGANRHYLLLPCHRVLPSSMKIGGFYWGSDLKQRLLQSEATLLNP